MAIAANLGFPRIGPRRQLKRAVEDFWAGNIDPEELIPIIEATVQATLARNRDEEQQLGDAAVSAEQLVLE